MSPVMQRFHILDVVGGLGGDGDAMGLVVGGGESAGGVGLGQGRQHRGQDGKEVLQGIDTDFLALSLGYYFEGTLDEFA